MGPQYPYPPIEEFLLIGVVGANRNSDGAEETITRNRPLKRRVIIIWKRGDVETIDSRVVNTLVDEGIVYQFQAFRILC